MVSTEQIWGFTIWETPRLGILQRSLFFQQSQHPVPNTSRPLSACFGLKFKLSRSPSDCLKKTSGFHLVTVLHQLSWALLALAFGTKADDETSGIRPLAAHSSVLPVAAKRITSWQRLGPFKHRHSSEEWLLVGFHSNIRLGSPRMGFQDYQYHLVSNGVR